MSRNLWEYILMPEIFITDMLGITSDNDILDKLQDKDTKEHVKDKESK